MIQQKSERQCHLLKINISACILTERNISRLRSYAAKISAHIKYTYEQHMDGYVCYVALQREGSYPGVTITGQISLTRQQILNAMSE
jgi:hypothetical protein